MQLKIAVSLLFKIASIDPVKNASDHNSASIFFYQLERHLSLCHIKK